jgi:CHRD domain
MRGMLGLVSILAVEPLALTPSAAASDNLVANLSGKHEVSARDTQAVAVATFKLRADGTQLQFKINVANLDNAVAAHIHCAAVGVNCPVGVTLFGGAPGGSGVSAGDAGQGHDQRTGSRQWLRLDEPGDGGRNGDPQHLHQCAHQRPRAADRHQARGLPRRRDPRPGPLVPLRQGS